MNSPTMLAAVITSVGTLDLATYPVPEPGPGEVLVAVRAAGICHTDLHLLRAVPDVPPLPLVPGHEIAGDIVRGGPGVTGLEPGQRVLVYYYDGCRECRWCRSGEENLCRSPRSKWGFTKHGGYAEYVTATARCCLPLPESLSYESAATLGCAGTTAVHAVRRVADVAAGETVVVLGVGGVGLAILQVAVDAGARVIAVGRSRANLAEATALGAQMTVNAGEEDLIAVVSQATGAAGCDVVFDLVGSAQTPDLATRMLRPAGRLVLVGYTGEHANLDVARVIMAELAVRGSVGATLEDAREAVAMASAGRLRATVSGRYPLTAAREAMSRLLDDSVTGRVVLVPHGE